MDEAIRLVNSLSDVQAVSLLKKLNRDIFKAVPYTEVQTNLPSDLQDINDLLVVDPEFKKKNLDPSDSVEGTRKILLAFARDANLAPIFMQAWNEIKDDDSLFIEVIIAVGLLVNLTLFMASSDIEFNIGRLKVKKHKADAAVVREVLKPVVELIKKSTP